MRPIAHSLMIVLGWLLLIPGLIFVILPPPFAFGIFMVLPGIAILVGYSKGMRRLVQHVRGRYSIVDRALTAVETRVPDFIGRNLKRTNPAALARALRWRKRARAARNRSTDKTATQASEGDSHGRTPPQPTV